MGSLLLIGLLIGMRHALEADHIAAVASLTSRKLSFSSAVRLGGAWGAGHTITLFLFGSVVIFMDRVLSEGLVQRLELAVGGMLVLLGLDLLRRVIRDRIHFHSHGHADGHFHFHAHSHAGESPVGHNPAQHDHGHLRGFPIRALMIGLMHGMAGSAAVIALTLESVESPLQGMLYILMFGIGSLLGMALLSVAISIPIHLSARRLTWAHNALQVAVGCVTTGLGIWVIINNGAVSFA